MTPRTEVDRRDAFRKFLWVLDGRQCRMCGRDVALSSLSHEDQAQVYRPFDMDDYDPRGALILCPACHHDARSRFVHLMFENDAMKCRGPMTWERVPQP